MAERCVACMQAEGVAQVCAGLTTTRLAHVDLSDNGLSDDGAAALAGWLAVAGEIEGKVYRERSFFSSLSHLTLFRASARGKTPSR